jgi:hypothetical protein
LYGRNSTISTPEAKFDSEPCSASKRCRLNSQSADCGDDDENQQHHANQVADEGLESLVDLLFLQHRAEPAHDDIDDPATGVEDDNRGQNIQAQVDSGGLQHVDGLVPGEAQVGERYFVHFCVPFDFLFVDGCARQRPVCVKRTDDAHSRRGCPIVRPRRFDRSGRLISRVRASGPGCLPRPAAGDISDKDPAP